MKAKKLIGFMLSLSMIFAAVPAYVHAAETNDIGINETNFPDENFRNYLLNQNYGKDKIITETELTGIKNINVLNKNISSIKGIENFTYLERFSAYNNNLTEVDLSKNTNLTSCSLSKNKLTNIDLTANTKLQSIDISENEFTDTSFKFPETDTVKTIYVNNNNLTTFDCTKYKNLDYLNIKNNQVSSIKPGENLTKLNLEGNNITSLNDINCPKLKELILNNNTNLTSVDLTSLPALQRLFLENTNITSLDLSKNVNLMNLRILNSPVAQLNNLDNCTSLETLYLNNCNVSSVDLSSLNKIKNIYCISSPITTLDTSSVPTLEIINCRNVNIRSVDCTNKQRLKEVTLENTNVVALDLTNSGFKPTSLQASKVNVTGNSRIVLDGSPISELEGFDVTNILSIEGGDFKNDTVNFAKGSDTITYQYKVNKKLNRNENYAVSFSLKKHAHTASIVEGKTPTCTEDGYKDYYTCECGANFEDKECTTAIEDIEAWKVSEEGGKLAATGHNWNKPVYTWNEENGNQICVATRTCANDETHTEVVTANVTSKVTKKPGATTKGETTYTAAFTEEWAEDQVLIVEDIDATGEKPEVKPDTKPEVKPDTKPANKPANKPAETTNNKKPSKTPKTGDNTPIEMTFAATILSLAGILVIRRKRALF